MEKNETGCSIIITVGNDDYILLSHIVAYYKKDIYEQIKQNSKHNKRSPTTLNLKFPRAIADSIFPQITAAKQGDVVVLSQDYIDIYKFEELDCNGVMCYQYEVTKIMLRRDSDDEITMRFWFTAKLPSNDTYPSGTELWSSAVNVKTNLLKKRKC